MKLNKDGTPRKPMGRPRIEFTDDVWKQIDSMCHIQCTEIEIAAVLGISIESLKRACKKQKKRTFVQYRKEKAEGGKMSLRRAMWAKATQKDSATMQIWLSKNVLGYSDKQEVSGAGGEGLIINFMAKSQPDGDA